MVLEPNGRLLADHSRNNVLLHQLFCSRNFVISENMDVGAV